MELSYLLNICLEKLNLQKLKCFFISYLQVKSRTYKWKYCKLKECNYLSDYLVSGRFFRVEMIQTRIVFMMAGGDVIRWTKPWSHVWSCCQVAPGGCAADCQNSLQYLLGGKTFFLYCKDKNVAVNFSGWLRGLLLRLLAGVWCSVIGYHNPTI